MYEARIVIRIYPVLSDATLAHHAMRNPVRLFVTVLFLGRSCYSPEGSREGS
jgi:hypothetical protein